MIMYPINEKRDLEGTAQQGETALTTNNVDFERDALLASLPDPDEGKSEEEKKAIDKKLMWKVDLWLVPWLSVL
jgi:hypothetical protein